MPLRETRRHFAKPGAASRNPAPLRENERFTYQPFVVAIDLDGDERCGPGDEVTSSLTNGWNPSDNSPYIERRPWFGDPSTSGEDCPAVDDCTPP